MDTQHPVVKMSNIVKVYPNGVMANEGVDFCVSRGEIHALVGENGAGKTTLMKILFGIEEPTSGAIHVRGKPVKIHSVAQALGMGMGMVQQHFMLVSSMTVAENILLGAEPTRGLLLNREEAVRQTRQLCEKYSFNIDVNARVEDLPVGDKQKVEILKVLYRQAQVIILDEPTAVLTPQETVELFKQLVILKEEGHTIVFISHKLREVRELCDRVTIMRKGRTVGTFLLREITTEEISTHMMGQEIGKEVEKSPGIPGESRLSVRGVSYLNEENREVVSDISFTLRAGEILGLVGVEGNGQKELADMITGSAKCLSGSITLNGVDIAGKTIGHIRSVLHRKVQRIDPARFEDTAFLDDLNKAREGVDVIPYFCLIVFTVVCFYGVYFAGIG